MARNKNVPFKGRIQKRKTNFLQVVIFGLQRAAGPYSRAKNESMQRSEQYYSITSSAKASNIGGISNPSALAVFKLMTNSNRVGNSTGRSAGFAPWSMRAT